TLLNTFFARFDGDSQRTRRASGTGSSGSSVAEGSASGSASGNSGGTSNSIASMSSGNGGATSVETVDYRSVISETTQQAEAV
ncbi:hydroxyacid dehydrogenase, partial [Pseudomonas syringae pv. tagetis]